MCRNLNPDDISFSPPALADKRQGPLTTDFA